MRKLLKISLILIFSINIVNASYVLTREDKKIVQNITTKIENIITKYWYSYKQKLVNAFEKVKIKQKIGSKWREIIWEILDNTKEISLKWLSNNHYKEYKLDFNEIRDTWVSWHNNERKRLWINNLTSDDKLENTAYEWSLISKNKWVLDHKRNNWDSYYDYNIIKSWFWERWVDCKVKNRTTESESIWRFSYKCIDDNCTDEFLVSLRKIFDYYMNEKWLPYPQNAHYKTIVHPDLSKLWFWFTILDNTWKDWRYEYYAVTHYCTEFVN